MTNGKLERSLRGYEMSTEEIEDFLREKGVGILSLARGNEAYSLPMSFGYDGGTNLYFFMIRFGEKSEKFNFASASDRVCFVVYDVESQERWKSVVAKGRLEPLMDADVQGMERIMMENAWFPDLFPYGGTIKGHAPYQMVVDEMTGQKGKGYVDSN